MILQAFRSGCEHGRTLERRSLRLARRAHPRAKLVTFGRRAVIAVKVIAAVDRTPRPCVA
jgi:hypothetical protein